MKRDTPSLFGGSKKSVSEATNAPKQTLSEPFEEEALQSAWKTFGDAHRENGAGDVERLILSRDLKKIEASVIQIELVSSLEATILEHFEVELLQFLRKTLKNDQVRLEKKIAEKKVGQQLYTSQDIYDFMVQKNPKLAELRDRLGLDLEY